MATSVGMAMVSLGSKIVLLGGGDSLDSLDEIYEIDCVLCDWNLLPISMTYARRYFVALAIPDNYTTCPV